MLPAHPRSSIFLARAITAASKRVRLASVVGCIQAPHRRRLGSSPALLALKPYLLADIGEGITECQVISWAVKPGDKVEQFDLICEVQSDKASVEGTIERLHYETGDLAKVGSALLDIDVPDDSHGNAELSEPGLGEDSANKAQELVSESEPIVEHEMPSLSSIPTNAPDEKGQQALSTKGSSSAMVTPAVRRLLKENNINIEDIRGAGKGGRILKEDVMRYIGSSANTPHQNHQAKNEPSAIDGANPNDRRLAMSPIQTQMFKAMTSSLAIPHFLYTHKTDLTAVMDLCERFKSDPAPELRHSNDTAFKLTPLPFIMKALSNALIEFPLLNSTWDTSTLANGHNHELIIRGQHNFGMAVDTPKGLLVPVVRDVQNHSILSLAAEISRLGKLARDGKLSPDDMKDGTIVISNIGSIGGQVVAPVILSPMTAIIAVGKIENEPVFEKDDDGVEKVVRKKRSTLSWSADHRIIDGATVARCAQQVQGQLERPESIGLDLE